MGRARQVLDAVHRYIDVPVELDRIVDSPAVQRLRRVSQTALASMVYPSANGSRFEHALGAMHLAGQAFNHAWDNSSEHARERLRALAAHDIPGLLPQESSEARDIFSTAVAGVGLLHDIGHPPFSHALEEYFETNASSIFADTPSFQRDIRLKRAKPFHELAGEAMLDDLADRFDSQDHFSLLKAIYLADPDDDGWASALHAIVSGTVDIDRIDYIMRDSYHAGTEYGAIDASRLIASLEFRTTASNNVRLALGLRARSAAELLLVQRIQAYRWMYLHPRVVAAEVLLRRALEELRRADSWHTGSQLETDKATAIRRLTPTLNYVKPSSSYHLAEGATERDSRSGPESESPLSNAQDRLPFEVDITDSSTRDDSRDIFSEVQMSVTDDAILRYCSNAALYCYTGNPSGSQPDGPTRYLYYYGASLRRSSDLVILWKRNEEYAEVASRLYKHSIVEAFISKSREAGKNAATGLSGAARTAYLSQVDALT